MAGPHTQCPAEHQAALEPSLVAGETQQAFLTVEYQPETFQNIHSRLQMTEVSLRSELRYADGYSTPTLYVFSHSYIGIGMSTLGRN